MQKQTNDAKEKQTEELVVQLKSVVKVTKGGRQRRFSAVVVVGDRKGHVGIGTGKALKYQMLLRKQFKMLIRI